MNVAILFSNKMYFIFCAFQNGFPISSHTYEIKIKLLYHIAINQLSWLSHNPTYNTIIRMTGLVKALHLHTQ